MDSAYRRWPRAVAAGGALDAIEGSCFHWAMRAVCLTVLVCALSACDKGDDTAAASTGALPTDHPTARCPTASMIDAYPGAYPNQPYGPQPAASACIATAHDVIVVLGCPNADDGQPAPCQTERADIAVALMEAGYSGRFITSGGAVHNEWVEAETLRDLLVERGAPSDRILLEPEAQHTDENIYYASRIMQDEGFASALVVSEDPGHLILTAVCDSNCCVALGRLTVLELPIAGGAVVAGHYALYPYAAEVSEAECAHIEQGSKFMCTNLATRKACAGDFQL
jgi:hypothetical protein